MKSKEQMRREKREQRRRDTAAVLTDEAIRVANLSGDKRLINDAYDNRAHIKRGEHDRASFWARAVITDAARLGYK